MLTRLLPDQVSRFWDIIKFAIEESLPPVAYDHPDKMERILSSLLSGKAECWASYIRDEETTRFEGVVITRILHDDVSITNNLLIYCLYGYERIEKDSWIKGLHALAKYANSRNCSRIIAYTDIPYVTELAKKLGGEARYTFLSFDTKQIVKKFNGLEG